MSWSDTTWLSLEGVVAGLQAVDKAIEYNKDSISGSRFVPGDSLHDALYWERDQLLEDLKAYRR
jgi:hypothetical protein